MACWDQVALIFAAVLLLWARSGLQSLVGDQPPVSLLVLDWLINICVFRLAAGDQGLQLQNGSVAPFVPGVERLSALLCRCSVGCGLTGHTGEDGGVDETRDLIAFSGSAVPKGHVPIRFQAPIVPKGDSFARRVRQGSGLVGSAFQTCWVPPDGKIFSIAM